jgi:NADH-quinone oxidoreductase E subunit
VSKQATQAAARGVPVAFGPEALAEYERILARYPQRRAALMPVLWLAQREFGWVGPAVQAYVAELMALPLGWVEGAVTFYTMYYRRPMGRHHIQVCTNLSCRLRGADLIVSALRHHLDVEPGHTSANGEFSLDCVECLGSCGTAPVLQIGSGKFVENLDVASTLKLVERLAKGEETGDV